jgi:flagellar motor switch protein FliN/FliY
MPDETDLPPPENESAATPPTAAAEPPSPDTSSAVTPGAGAPAEAAANPSEPTTAAEPPKSPAEPAADADAGPAPADRPVVDNTIDQAELDALADQLGQKVENTRKAVDQAELTALKSQVAVTGASATAGTADDDLAREMAAAIAAEATGAAGAGTPAVLGSDVTVAPSAATAFQPPELADTARDPEAAIDLLDDVQLDVKIELGRTDLYIEDVMRLGVGSVVELNKLAGDPVDIYVNERLIARGEVLVLNDNFCIRISEIVAGLDEEAHRALAQAVSER